MGGTGKGLLKGYVLPSPFLRTASTISARIPLPPPVVLRAANHNLNGCRWQPYNNLMCALGAHNSDVRLPLAIVDRNRFATPRERGYWALPRQCNKR